MVAVGTALSCHLITETSLKPQACQQSDKAALAGPWVPNGHEGNKAERVTPMLFHTENGLGLFPFFSLQSVQVSLHNKSIIAVM